MFRHSLRQFAIILIGISVSFAIGFLPIQQLGFLPYMFVVDSILIGICWMAVNLINRNAIAIALLFTLAAALGVHFALPSLPPRYSNIQAFAVLLGLLGFMPMLIAIPLTIHRLTGLPKRE
jgi:hypothetical protein